MKRIVVTGGAGRLGRKVIEDLIARDYDVVSIDEVRPGKVQCPFMMVDLTDPAAVRDALSGADGVIHLGAVPGPLVKPASVTFDNNVQSTWQVLETAAALGVSRVVSASSVFTLGWHQSADVYWPKYVPVDEDHPLTPYEAYGLSKVIGEDICGAVSRRTGMPTISLRIMNVIQEDGYFALPWPIPTREQPVRFVLWPYVDVRDAAVACRQALEAKTTGHEALFIAADDIRFDASTESLLREFAPQVEIRKRLSGTASVISINKARELIGYQPLYSWRGLRSSEHS